MSSTASPFFADFPASHHGRELPRASVLEDSAHSHRDLFGETPSVDLPATPAVNLLRVTCGLSAEEAEQLLSRAESAAESQRRALHRSASAWDRTAVYALLGIAFVVVCQLL